MRRKTDHTVIPAWTEGQIDFVTFVDDNQQAAFVIDGMRVIVRRHDVATLQAAMMTWMKTSMPDDDDD